MLQLNNKEMALLALIANGFSSGELAESYGVSLKTIEARGTALRKKIAINKGKKRVGLEMLMVCANDEGLVPIHPLVKTWVDSKVA